MWLGDSVMSTPLCSWGGVWCRQGEGGWWSGGKKGSWCSLLKGALWAAAQQDVTGLQSKHSPLMLQVKQKTSKAPPMVLRVIYSPPPPAPLLFFFTIINSKKFWIRCILKLNDNLSVSVPNHKKMLSSNESHNISRTHRSWTKRLFLTYVFELCGWSKDSAETSPGLENTQSGPKCSYSSPRTCCLHASYSYDMRVPLSCSVLSLELVVIATLMETSKSWHEAPFYEAAHKRRWEIWRGSLTSLRFRFSCGYSESVLEGKKQEEVLFEEKENCDKTQKQHFGTYNSLIPGGALLPSKWPWFFLVSPQRVSKHPGDDITFSSYQSVRREVWCWSEDLGVC